MTQIVLRPLKTAPKTFKPIMLVLKNGEIVSARYYLNKNCWITEVGSAKVIENSLIVKGWYPYPEFFDDEDSSIPVLTVRG